MMTKIVNEPDLIKIDGIVLNINNESLSSYKKAKIQQNKIVELETKIHNLELLVNSILKERI